MRHDSQTAVGGAAGQHTRRQARRQQLRQQQQRRAPELSSGVAAHPTDDDNETERTTMSDKQTTAQRRVDWSKLPREVQQARIPGTTKIKVTREVCVALLRQQFQEAEPNFYDGWAEEMLAFTLERLPVLLRVFPFDE